MKKCILTVMLLLSITFTACAGPISKNSSNLMDNIQKSDLAPIEISDASQQQSNRKEKITDFALKLFKENFEDKNILISPISIVSALGMLANGANDNTLSEMEEALNSDIQGLNDYLKAYTAYLPSSDKIGRAHV